MKDCRIVNIDVSKNYPIYIGKNLLENIGNFTKKVKENSKVLIITDVLVKEIYGSKVIESLRSSGFIVDIYVVERGENSKSITIAENILEYLADNNYHRSDLLVALGGGVVGDLTGFIAGIFNRGMDFIQVPTTFLSAIDSSVGGKTGVNLKAGKNLVGVFNQPLAVVCSTDCFLTLDDKYFSDGVAEAIKYSMIMDKELFYKILKNPLKKCDVDIDSIVERCVRHKKTVVSQDEYDTGIRQILNFGHTLGHSIEKISNYSITHGHGVAIGMAYITKASYKSGECDKSTYEQLIQCLTNNNLPTSVEYSSEQLAEWASKDKKATNDNITIVIPKRIGECYLKKVSFDNFNSYVKLAKE